MRKLKINFLLIPVSAILGFVSFFLLLTVLLFFSPGAFIERPDAEGALLSGTALLAILIGYIFLMIWSGKKGDRSTIKINLLVYIFFLIVTPFLQREVIDYYSNINSGPSEGEEREILSKLDKEIEQGNLSYQIDIEQSIERLKQYGEKIWVVLVKETNDEINREEVFTLINKLPDKEINLVLYERDKKDFISVNVDPGKKVWDCEPYAICNELKITE